MTSVQEELVSIQQILHLTNHRNKNQHRIAKWWKFFSQLHRHVAKLIAELEMESETQLVPAKKKNKKSREDGKSTSRERQQVEQRVGFMEDFLIPKCYVAFSAVVADNQYAALGIMLLGTLARIRTTIAPLRKDEEKGGDMEDSEIKTSQIAGLEDLGVAVSREEVKRISERGDEVASEDGQDSIEEKKPKKKRSDSHKQVLGSTPSKRPNKRRKRVDAFDDLFDKLI